MAALEAERTVNPADDYLVIGRIVAPHGVRGEVKVDIEAEDPGRFSALDVVYLGPRHSRYEVESTRLHKGRVLLLVKGIADRNAAETLRGQMVMVAVEDAIPLEEGAYYYHEVEGLQVVDEEGRPLGVLTEILATGANDVYVIQGARGELLLPAIRGVVLAIEPEEGRVVVKVPTGLDSDE